MRLHAFLLGMTTLASACAVPVAGTSPSTAAPPASPTPEIAGDIVSRTNAERAAHGLFGLTRSDALMRAAQIHAEQMAAQLTMSHELPEARYPTLSTRLAAVGYKMLASAENIAEGYSSAASVVAGWMSSTGHRENILSTRYAEMGAGMAIGRNGRRFYAQGFGRPPRRRAHSTTPPPP